MEIVTALRRRQERREMSTSNVRTVLGDLDELEVVATDTRLLAEESLELCDSLNHESLYIALAKRWNAPLCTFETSQAEKGQEVGIRVLVPGTREANGWPP
jgi:predicted nucleic acid-binding protein